MHDAGSVRLNGRDEHGFSLDAGTQRELRRDARLRAAVEYAETYGVQAAAMEFRVSRSDIYDALTDDGAEEDA